MKLSDLDLDDLAQQQAWEAKQAKYRAWYRQVFGHEPEELPGEKNNNQTTNHNESRPVRKRN